MANIVDRIMFDDSQAISSLKSYQSELKKIPILYDEIERESRDTFKAQAQQFTEAEKNLQGVERRLEKVMKAQIDANKSAKEGQGVWSSLSGVFAEADSQLGGIIGKLNAKRKALLSTQSGVGGLTRSFKALRVAIVSTGIGALVLALTSLVALFAKSEQGAKLMELGINIVGATVGVLVDRVGKLSGAVAALFRGDFKEAAAIAKEAVAGVNEEAANYLLNYHVNGYSVMVIPGHQLVLRNPSGQDKESTSDEVISKAFNQIHVNKQ